MNNFRIVSLKLLNHPFLGDILDKGLEFVDADDDRNGPYTTVIIGPNGTGKSQILRLISDILEEIRSHSLNRDKYKFRTNFHYDLVLMHASKYFLIEFRRRLLLSREERGMMASRELKVFLLDAAGLEKVREVENNGEMLPLKLVVNSFLVNDKFRFATRGTAPTFYNYLGVRDSAGTARTRSYVRTIIGLLLTEVSKRNGVKNLQEILRYIHYDESFLGISYSARYRASFFSGELTVERFHELFGDFKLFSERERESFALPVYRTMKEDKRKVEQIVGLLNRLAHDMMAKTSQKSRININLFQKQNGIKVLGLLNDLLKLDLIASPSISFKKHSMQLGAPEIEVDKFSSGEFNLFASIVALKSVVCENSLILVDEPEISLHPNWQMKYVEFLRQVFAGLKSVHFLIATHSHFLISDLKNESSQIVKLGRVGDKLNYYSVKGDTYGQSAENILYNIFGMRSSRNYYFEMEIRQLLTLISREEGAITLEERIQAINAQVAKLSAYTIDKNDPLNLILEQAREFVRNS